MSEEKEQAEIDERKPLRKLDLNILPGVILLFLLSFLDLSNVRNARIEGLATDTHMTGNQYLTTLSVYFIGCILFEIPCNVSPDSSPSASP